MIAKNSFLSTRLVLASLIGAGAILPLGGCNDDNDPQYPPGAIRLKALTAVDGVAADALRAHNVVWDNRSNKPVDYRGLLIDGDYLSGPDLREQKVVADFLKAGKFIVLIDLNQTHRAAMVTLAGASPQHPTHGAVYHRGTLSNGQAALAIYNFNRHITTGGVPVFTSETQRSADAEVFAQETVTRIQNNGVLKPQSSRGPRIMGDSDNNNTTNNLPALLPANMPQLVVSNTVTTTLYTNPVMTLYPDMGSAVNIGNDLPETGRWSASMATNNTPTLKLTDTHNIYVMHDNRDINVGGGWYYVANAPSLFATPYSYTENQEIITDAPGGCDYTGHAQVYRTAYPQTQWTLIWTLTDQDGQAPIQGDFGQVDSQPPNTNGVTELGTSSNFAVGYSSGTSLLSYDWTTSTTVDITDWATINNSQDNTQQWTWSSQNPQPAPVNPNPGLSYTDWSPTYAYVENCHAVTGDCNWAFNTLNKAQLQMWPVYAWRFGDEQRLGGSPPTTMELTFNAQAQSETWQYVDEAWCFDFNWFMGSGYTSSYNDTVTLDFSQVQPQTSASSR